MELPRLTQGVNAPYLWLSSVWGPQLITHILGGSRGDFLLTNNYLRRSRFDLRLREVVNLFNAHFIERITQGVRGSTIALFTMTANN